MCPPHGYGVPWQMHWRMAYPTAPARRCIKLAPPLIAKAAATLRSTRRMIARWRPCGGALVTMIDRRHRCSVSHFWRPFHARMGCDDAAIVRSGNRMVLRRRAIRGKCCERCHFIGMLQLRECRGGLVPLHGTPLPTIRHTSRRLMPRTAQPPVTLYRCPWSSSILTTFSAFAFSRTEFGPC